VAPVGEPPVGAGQEVIMYGGIGRDRLFAHLNALIEAETYQRLHPCSRRQAPAGAPERREPEPTTPAAGQAETAIAAARGAAAGPLGALRRRMHGRARRATAA
jgi:hypothetical protein